MTEFYDPNLDEQWVCDECRPLLCSECLNGGDLIMCNNYERCGYQYHLECVGLSDDVPAGDFFCKECSKDDDDDDDHGGLGSAPAGTARAYEKRDQKDHSFEDDASSHPDDGSLYAESPSEEDEATPSDEEFIDDPIDYGKDKEYKPKSDSDNEEDMEEEKLLADSRWELKAWRRAGVSLIDDDEDEEVGARPNRDQTRKRQIHVSDDDYNSDDDNSDDDNSDSDGDSEGEKKKKKKRKKKKNKKNFPSSKATYGEEKMGLTAGKKKRAAGVPPDSAAQQLDGTVRERLKAVGVPITRLQLQSTPETRLNQEDQSREFSLGEMREQAGYPTNVFGIFALVSQKPNKDGTTKHHYLPKPQFKLFCPSRKMGKAVLEHIRPKKVNGNRDGGDCCDIHMYGGTFQEYYRAFQDEETLKKEKSQPQGSTRHVSKMDFAKPRKSSKLAKLQEERKLKEEMKNPPKKGKKATPKKSPPKKNPPRKKGPPKK